MILKYFYDPGLAHASYLVGCQKTGEALVIDPARDIEPYLQAAATEELKIVAAAETHIHADFVSGARELADRVGAILYLSNEGPPEWKYLSTKLQESRLVGNGDVIHIGKVRLAVLPTPGHTPEHISFLLTDEGGGATTPMGIFTGDFVFVGSIGRPDLLETAAGVKGSAELGARQLYHSMRRFLDLPDYLQVWPAHGAGSACGKGLGAIPSSTVGYERRYNPALQFDDEQKFVDYILADQPETPFYFAEMKRVNKAGHELIRKLPPIAFPKAAVLGETAKSTLTIDTTSASSFAAAHVPKTINIPSDMLAQWAGFLVDYTQPLNLIADAASLTSVLKALRSIGIDKVQNVFDASEVQAAGLRTESYASVRPDKLHEAIRDGELKLLDVRARSEYLSEHAAYAEHRFLGNLMQELGNIDRTVPIVTQCQKGGRAAIATSILQRAGFDVLHMAGGFRAWAEEGLPVTRPYSLKQ